MVMINSDIYSAITIKLSIIYILIVLCLLFVHLTQLYPNYRLNCNHDNIEIFIAIHDQFKCFHVTMHELVQSRIWEYQNQNYIQF